MSGVHGFRLESRLESQEAAHLSFERDKVASCKAAQNAETACCRWRSRRQTAKPPNSSAELEKRGQESWASSRWKMGP